MLPQREPHELNSQHHDHDRQDNHQVQEEPTAAFTYLHHHHLPAPVQQVDAEHLPVAHARHRRQVLHSEPVVQLHLLQVENRQLFPIGQREPLLRAEAAVLIGRVRPRPHLLLLLHQHEIPVFVYYEGGTDTPEALHFPGTAQLVEVDGADQAGGEGSSVEREMVEFVSHVDVMTVADVRCEGHVALLWQGEGGFVETCAVIDSLDFSQLQRVACQEQVGHVALGLLGNREWVVLDVPALHVAGVGGVHDAEAFRGGHRDETLLQTFETDDCLFNSE